MYLVRLCMTRVGPFDDAEVSFNDDGEPRLLTVIYGGGAVGKTTLLSAIASTRPGHAIVTSGLNRDEQEPGQVVCEFSLGQDDPDRPHVLVVATPTARVYDDQEQEAKRRREQTLFDKVARESGFAFVAFPATRWFSRQPIALLSPGRSLARYDVRAPINVDDITRGDLARETKQCLAYAAITSALEARENSPGRFSRLAFAMQHAVDTLVQLVGLRWAGVDPLTFEPLFENSAGVREAFDQLSTRARHLVAFSALTVRALWAASPARSPLDVEGLVTIDEADLHLDPTLQSKLPEALRLALPNVQWVLTSTAPFLASGCDASSIVALRRRLDHSDIELYRGELARTH